MYSTHTSSNDCPNLRGSILPGVVCLALAVGTATNAVGDPGETSLNAPALFTEAPNGDSLVVDSLVFADNADTTLGATVVRFHHQALHWLPNPDGRAIHAETASLSGAPFVGGRFQVLLEPGIVEEAQIDSVQQYVEGVHSYVGHVVGQPDSFVTIGLNGAHVHGLIDAVTGRYEIDPLMTAAGRHADLLIVRRLDLQAFARARDLDHVLASASGGTKQHTHAPAKPVGDKAFATLKSGTTDVSVMVLYTAPTSAERNMPTFINNLMSTMNTALNNTGNVGEDALLAHEEEISFTSTGSRLDDREHMVDRNDGVMDYIDDLQAAWDGDMTLLITDDDAYPIGGGIAVFYTEADPFAISSDDWALGDYNAIHEAGHVWGGFHQTRFLQNDTDPDRDFTNPDFDTGYGHELDDESQMTMMGTCESDGSTMCSTRKLFFSNPNKDFPGTSEPRGVPGTDPEPADMNTALNASLPGVAAWDDADASAPGAPSSVDVEPLQCYGQNTVTWNAASGEVGEYRVFMDDSTSFPSPTLLYRGRDTAVGISISSDDSPAYIGIRACNAGGCSSYALGDEQATYTNGCL